MNLLFRAHRSQVSRLQVSKVQLQRAARTWHKERLTPESVFIELRPIYRRFPPLEEELGGILGVGTVMGVVGFFGLVGITTVSMW